MNFVLRTLNVLDLYIVDLCWPAAALVDVVIVVATLLDL